MKPNLSISTKIILLTVFGFLSFIVYSQSPESINYQAVARDADGKVKMKTSLDVRIGIYSGITGATKIYEETHTVTTNDFGLFDLHIGEGSLKTGNFSAIPWASNAIWLQIEIDDTPGSGGYVLMDKVRFVSVPYALHAKTVEVDQVDDNDSDPTNELQTLQKTGNIISLSNNGGAVTDEVNDADNDPANELQTLSINSNQLTISGGNTVTISGGQTYSAGTGLTLNGTTFNALNNTDIWNANALRGYPVSLSTPSLGEVLKWNGSSWGPGPITGNSVWSQSLGDIYYNLGNVGIGTSSPTHRLHISGYNSALRLEGTGSLGQYARLNYGDGQYVYIEEDNDDDLKIHVEGRLLLDAESIEHNGPNGYSNIKIEDNPYSSNNGWLGVYDDAGLLRCQSAVLGTGEGFSEFFGPNGNTNIRLTTLLGYSNNGYIAVFNSSGTDKVGMYVNSSGQGIVYGDVKNFRMKYPGNKGKEIWYASIEGPEAGTYIRGTGKLVNGRAKINFPEHFQIVANGQTMTVILTPLDASSLGLAVTEKGDDGFTVVELQGGTGSYEFDWEVKCIRSGYEDYKVIRDESSATSSVQHR